ncbi:hypothetical protein ACFOU2_20550, partial [Bacillus songklensis]
FIQSRGITIGDPDNLNSPSRVHLSGWRQPRKGGASRLGLENLAWPFFGQVEFSKSIYIIYKSGKKIFRISYYFLKKYR